MPLKTFLMTPENKTIFANWLAVKYSGSNAIFPSKEDLASEEWWANEEREFKKYHPSAGTFIRNLSMDDFINEINKIKKR